MPEQWVKIIRTCWFVLSIYNIKSVTNVACQVLLLRLRQAACHPHLIMDFDEVEADASPEDMIEMAKQLTPDVVKRIMEAAGVFECPVCNHRILVTQC